MSRFDPPPRSAVHQQQQHGQTTQLWKENDAKAQKHGQRRTMFWVEKKPKDKYALSSSTTTARIPKSNYQSGAKYEGDWLDDAKHGYGIQVWANGNKYEGEWERGRRGGHGTFWVKDGKKLRKVYTGNWKSGLKDGLGVYFYKNGNRYEGQWKNGMRDGQGTLFYGNGDTYVGSWFEDKPSGQGTLTKENGDVYEGEWLNGKKEGPGIFYFKSKEKIYDGEWVNDIPKCGVYLDATEFFGELEQKQPQQVLRMQGKKKPKPIPMLELEDARSVLEQRILEIQQERYNIRSLASHDLGELFSEEDLDMLRGTFSRADDGRGRVEVTNLAFLLESVGYTVSDNEVAYVLAGLNFNAKDSTYLNFGDFVKAVHIIRGMPDSVHANEASIDDEIYSDHDHNQQ